MELRRLHLGKVTVKIGKGVDEEQSESLLIGL